MDKRFLAILGALIILFIGIFAISSHKNNPPSTSSGQPSNHVEGEGSTGVKLVEYGDYECPVCADYYPAVKQAAAQFNAQIYYQFRNLPLIQIHQNAFAGARAAEAASLQGKFWQMHDALYVNQSQWSTSSNPLTFFDSYAKSLDLNMSKFNSDYSGDTANNSINADLAAFNKTGQPEATPTFFLDGKYVPNQQLIDSSTGSPSVAKFASVINAEIATKTKK